MLAKDTAAWSATGGRPGHDLSAEHLLRSTTQPAQRDLLTIVFVAWGISGEAAI